MKERIKEGKEKEKERGKNERREKPRCVPETEVLNRIGQFAKVCVC